MLGRRGIVAAVARAAIGSEGFRAFDVLCLRRDAGLTLSGTAIAHAKMPRQARQLMGPLRNQGSSRRRDACLLAETSLDFLN